MITWTIGRCHTPHAIPLFAHPTLTIFAKITIFIELEKAPTIRTQTSPHYWNFGSVVQTEIPVTFFPPDLSNRPIDICPHRIIWGTNLSWHWKNSCISWASFSFICIKSSNSSIFRALSERSPDILSYWSWGRKASNWARSSEISMVYSLNTSLLETFLLIWGWFRIFLAQKA